MFWVKINELELELGGFKENINLTENVKIIVYTIINFVILTINQIEFSLTYKMLIISFIITLSIRIIKRP